MLMYCYIFYILLIKYLIYNKKNYFLKLKLKMKELIKKENNINLFKGLFSELQNIEIEDFSNILLIKILLENYDFKLEYIKNWAKIEIKKQDNILNIKENNYFWNINSIFGHIINDVNMPNIIIIDVNKKIILSTIIFADIKK